MASSVSVEVLLTVALSAVLLASGAAADQRVDLYARDGARAGHAQVDPRTGRVDLYAPDGRRLGYGSARDGRVDLYRLDGRRLDPTRLEPTRRPSRK